MANKVYVATSLDGFIARANGDLDWLEEIPNPSGEDFGFAQFMESVDALVMGRNTFEKVLSFGGDWPYSKKVFVLTKSLTQLDSRLDEKVELLSSEIPSVLEFLESRGYRNLYVDGGRVVQSFLELDLIDELTITRVPVLLGEGLPLFGPQKVEKKFRHVRTEVFENGLVKSVYTRLR
jgi:dihydrofolate reductase